MKLFIPYVICLIYFASVCVISDGFIVCEGSLANASRLKSSPAHTKLQAPPGYSQLDGSIFLEKPGGNDKVVGDEGRLDGSFAERSQLNGSASNAETLDASVGIFSSVILLNFVAILWGTQHAIIKSLVNDTTPAAYSLLRFGLAALLASPYLPALPLKKTETGACEVWRWGSELAIYQFLGFALQAVGLETTSASRSGFLLYLNVKFVPLFSLLIFKKPISSATWISAFATFVGTALLATDSSEFGFCVGDIWSILAAASSAMFILRLEAASARVANASQLNAVCLSVVAILSCICAIAQDDCSVHTLLDTLTSHPSDLAYLSIVATALTNYLQTRAQRDISAERASIIYSLDPVYGAVFSWLLLHETLGAIQSYIGAALITVAAATNAFVDFEADTEKSDRWH